MCLQAVIKNTACQVTLPLKKNLKSSAPIKRIPKRLTGSKAILQGGSLFRGQATRINGCAAIAPARANETDHGGDLLVSLFPVECGHGERSRPGRAFVFQRTPPPTLSPGRKEPNRRIGIREAVLLSLLVTCTIISAARPHRAAGPAMAARYSKRTCFEKS